MIPSSPEKASRSDADTAPHRRPSETFEKAACVAKVDTQLGIVFGYACVCKVDGEDYYDSQGDNIDEDGLVEAAMTFVEKHAASAKIMHRGDNVGRVVFVFPLVGDVAKSLGIEASKTGLLIGWKPDDRGVLAKFASGEFTGFSIGGYRILDEEIAP